MPWVHVPDMNHRMYLQVHVPTVYQVKHEN